MTLNTIRSVHLEQFYHLENFPILQETFTGNQKN